LRALTGNSRVAAPRFRESGDCRAEWAALVLTFRRAGKFAIIV